MNFSKGEHVMRLVGDNMVQVVCEHCDKVSETDNMSQFQEDGLHPPSATFTCPACRKTARILYEDMPPILVADILNRRCVETATDFKERYEPLPKLYRARG